MTEEFESNLTDSHYTTEELENPPPRYHSKAILSFTENHCSPFVAQKEQNARHARKNSPTALCSQVAGNILRSGRSCRKQLVVQALGTKELAIHAITAAHFSTAQTTFVLSPLLERLFAVIFSVPVSYGNYLLCTSMNS